MTSSGHELILDSSVVLSKAFTNRRYFQRTEKLFLDVQKNSIQYKVTPAVIAECKRKTREVFAFVNKANAGLFTDFLTLYAKPLSRSAEVTVTMNDYPFIQSFFSNLSLGFKPDSTERERLEFVETYVIQNLDAQLQRASSVSLDTLLGIITAEINRMRGNVDLELATLLATSTQDAAANADRDVVAKKLPNIANLEDVRILAEIGMYSHKSGSLCVLATLDHPDLLNNQVNIKNAIGVVCADPLYVLYSLRHP